MPINTLTEFFERYQFKHPLVYIHKGQGLSTYAERLIPLIALVIQQTEPDERGMYWIDLKVAKAFMETSQHKRSYKPVLDAFEELFDIALAVNIFNQDKTFQDRKARIIYDRIVEGRSKGNLKRIGFAPHPEFVSKVQDPKVFAFYSIFMLAVLTEHKKSFTFYTICAGFWGCATKEERDEGVVKVTIPLTHLYAIFDVAGKYRQYKDFNKFLLKPVVAEVNKSSDFCIAYQGIRGKGRKIESVELSIAIQPWQIPLPNVENLKRIAQIVSDSSLFRDVAKLPPSLSPPLPTGSSPEVGLIAEDAQIAEEDRSDACIEWAAAYQISKGVVSRFIEENGLEAFEEVQAAFRANLAAARQGKAPPIKNETKLLGRFLSDKIGVKTSEQRAERAQLSIDQNQDEARAQTRAQIRAQSRKNIQILMECLHKLQEKLDELQRVHRQNCLEIVEDLLAALTPDEEAALARIFETGLNDPDSLDFQKYRWQAVTIMHKVLDFMRAQFPRKLPTFATLVKKETGQTLQALEGQMRRLERELAAAQQDKLL